MRFLNTRFSREITIENTDTVLEQSETVTNSIQEETPRNALETIPTAPTSTNLMSKFYRNQKTSTTEAPENLYENEAWAPKNEIIGLFRKRRMNVE